MAVPIVFRVAVENVFGIWEQVSPMLKHDPGYGVTHDAEDIRKMIMANQAHLWVQWDGEAKVVDVVLVTFFVNYPRGLFLNCWITCAAEDTKPLWDVFHKCMLDWAHKHGCVAILGQGRVGWMRKFPGCESGGQLMRIDL